MEPRIEYPVIGALYNHYKGGLYKVLTLAKHTDNDDVLVTCKSIHFGSIHARPLKEWFENVDKLFNTPRFKRFEK